MDPIVWKEISDALPKSTLELLLNPTAGAIGHTIAGIYYAIFGKLVRYGVVKEAETKALMKEVAEKFSNVPAKDRTDINKGLIFKAFEDSRYSLSSDELRQLFANLIVETARSSNVEKASPYFSTVLSNLTVEEAEFLEKFKTPMDKSDIISGPDYYVKSSLPIFKLTLRGRKGDINDIQEESTFTDKCKNSIASYSKPISVLSSFNIVQVKYGIGSRSDTENYKLLKQLSEYDDYLKAFSGQPSRVYMLTGALDTVDFVPGSVQLTSIGRSFAEMVLL